jgi:hypothetical protein
LGIVRRLSQLLDIPVQLDSTLGVGTRFSLRVQVIDGGDTRPAERKSDIARNKGKHVLLIEDDRSMRDARCATNLSAARRSSGVNSRLAG